MLVSLLYQMIQTYKLFQVLQPSLTCFRGSMTGLYTSVFIDEI